MTIARRLQVGSALIVGVIFIAMGITAYSINLVRIGGPIAHQIQASSDYIADILPPPEYVIEPFLEATLLAAHPEEVEKRTARLHALKRDYDTRHAYWQQSDLDPALVAALTQDAHAPAARFWDETHRLEAAAKVNDLTALRASYARLAADYAEHRAKIDQAVTLANDHQGVLKARSDTTLIVASFALLGLAGLVIALAMGARYYLDRRVMTPLRELMEATTALADGSDRSIPHIERDDELGAMARAVDFFRRSARERAAAEARNSAEQKLVAESLGHVLRTMAGGDLSDVEVEFPESYASVGKDLNRAVDTLRAMVRAVIDTTSDIRASSSSIASATDDLARRTESSASALEEASSTIAGMEVRLRSTAQAAQRSSEGSLETLGAAGEMRERTDEAVAAMRRVSESTAGIDNVIEGLDKIAFQTRVLAMNAAVEAGRAGDAGRGFAVVADLVSTLAMRAEEESRRARAQLSTTQQEVVIAVDAVGKVGGAIETILARCTEAAELTSEIASDNNAQALAITDVSGAVGKLDRIVQQNAAMVHQTSAAAASLAYEIEVLAGHAAAFRHDKGDRSPAAATKRDGPGAGAAAMALAA